MTGHWCSQPCGVVRGPFWYQVKAINVPDVVWIIFCLSRSEICLKGAHFMSLWPHVLPPLLHTAISISLLLYINKTLSQKTTCYRCSQPCGVVGGRFWYQVKAINVPEVVWIIFCLLRSEICLKGAHFMSLWPHVLPPLLDTAICISSLLYINKTLSQKTTGHWCSQPCGVVGGRFWYQVKAINVPDVVWIIFAS